MAPAVVSTSAVPAQIPALQPKLSEEMISLGDLFKCDTLDIAEPQPYANEFEEDSAFLLLPETQLLSTLDAAGCRERLLQAVPLSSAEVITIAHAIPAGVISTEYANSCKY